MTTKWVVAAAFVAAAGCAGPSMEEVEQGDAVSEGQALGTTCSNTSPRVITPRLQTSPSPYVNGQSLYPRGSKSAYTIVYKDPNDSRRFVAWGFDVVQKLNVFFVGGDTATQLNDFQRRVNLEMEAFVNANPIDFMIGGQSQVGRVPKGPPPPPVWPAFMLEERWVEAWFLHGVNEGTVSCGVIPSVPQLPGSIDAAAFLSGRGIPAGVRSLQVVTAENPRNATEFVVFVFDVENGIALYQVTGSKRDYTRVIARIESDISIPMRNPLFVGYGGAGQVGVKPRPGGPIGDWAWGQAVHTNAINK